MRSILKIGISIVGVLLLIKVFDNLYNVFSIQALGRNNFDRGLQRADYIITTIGTILQFITGLIFLLKPSVISNLYIPKNHQDLNTDIPQKIFISFFCCFGVYLMVNGSLSVINSLIFEIKELITKNTISIGWYAMIPALIKTGIGYFLYGRFKDELYKKEE